MSPRVKKVLRRGAIGAAVVFLVIQVVPYGRDHDNPPVTAEPNWDSQATRRLAVDACFSCHSNESEWPWYSNIASVSWMVQRDIDQGREALNFSEWDREQDEAKDAAETVADDEMPPLRYELVHPDARLSEAEKRRLIQGLSRTLGTDDNSGLGGGEDNSGPGGGD